VETFARTLTLGAFACSLSRAMRMPLRPLFLAVSAALAVLGCVEQPGTGTSSGTSASSGGSSGSSGSGTDGGSISKAGQACLDTAAAFATAAQRCGGNYDAERTAFIRDLANGDCNAVSIRNEAELRSGCIPSFSRISCTDLTQQRFAPSCAEQIIRSQ
jgi:hypothetical protein